MALQFTPEGEQKFHEITSRYPNTLAALQPVLLLAQSEFGWVSVEVMDYVAERLDLHPTKVLTTATFYSMYNKQPVGKCHVQVCTTLSCAFRGGYELLDHLEERWDITTGETNKDGTFSLAEVECLASCGTPAMFQVTYSDGEMEYFENLNDQSAIDEAITTMETRAKTLKHPKDMH